MGKYWKMKKVGVRQFYKEHLPSLPIDSKFRQYRVRTWDNNWIKIQDTIRTPKDLQRWLIRLAPRDVYFMTSRFLNPTKVGPRVLRKYKPGYNLAYNIFLGSELYFDFDYKNIHELKLFLKELKKDGYNDLKVIETARGFHIWVLDFEQHHSELKGILNPKEREQKHKLLKTKIAKKYSSLGYKFDFQVTIDTRRIIRVPGTLHGLTMELIKEVKI